MRFLKLSQNGLNLLKKHQAEIAANHLAKTEKNLNFFLQELNVQVTQHQFDALVCLAYQIGLGSLTKSKLAKKLYLMQQHDQKSIYAVADEFNHWTKVGGIVSPLLVQKRGAERLLFLGVS